MEGVEEGEVVEVEASVEDEDDDDEEEDVEEEASGDSERASEGTDLRARARTSTVSRRSPAKRVIAKSRACSFSLAALRWRLRKSAWRYRNRPCAGAREG